MQPNTLGKVTIYSSTHFAPKHPLPLRTLLLLGALCYSTHFTTWNTLLLCTLYSIAHFAPWNTLLPRVFCSLEHFDPKPHLLPKAYLIQKIVFTIKLEAEFCFRYFTSWSNEFQGAKMLGRKRCLRAKCSREEMVLRSKGFQGAKCVQKQSVPGSKRC